MAHVHYHPYAQAPSFLPGSGGCGLDTPVEQCSSEAKEIEVISKIVVLASAVATKKVFLCEFVCLFAFVFMCMCEYDNYSGVIFDSVPLLL